jgi:hypothetical protein
MSTTEDTMSSDRAPPERPDAGGEPPEEPTGDDEIDAERERAHDPLSNINTEPGDRYTENVELLVIEAELVADGHEPDNPAKIPEYADGTAERFAERLENHEDDLVPAWTRPWEGADE